jgi:ribonuclease E
VPEILVWPVPGADGSTPVTESDTSATSGASPGPSEEDPAETSPDATVTSEDDAAEQVAPLDEPPAADADGTADAAPLDDPSPEVAAEVAPPPPARPRRRRAAVRPAGPAAADVAIETVEVPGVAPSGTASPMTSDGDGPDQQSAPDAAAAAAGVAATAPDAAATSPDAAATGTEPEPAPARRPARADGRARSDG